MEISCQEIIYKFNYRKNNKEYMFYVLTDPPPLLLQTPTHLYSHCDAIKIYIDKDDKMCYMDSNTPLPPAPVYKTWYHAHDAYIFDVVDDIDTATRYAEMYIECL